MVYSVRLVDDTRVDTVPEPPTRPRKKRKFDPLKIRKWCSCREIDKMRQGRVNGIDSVDVSAVLAGQAAKRMRDYSRPVRVWELDDGQES